MTRDRENISPTSTKDVSVFLLESGQSGECSVSRRSWRLTQLWSLRDVYQIGGQQVICDESISAFEAFSQCVRNVSSSTHCPLPSVAPCRSKQVVSFRSKEYLYVSTPGFWIRLRRVGAVLVSLHISRPEAGGHLEDTCTARSPEFPAREISGTHHVSLILSGGTFPIEKLRGIGTMSPVYT